jgi:hypothetical protein
MRNPRTPGSGITGAWITLGSDSSKPSVTPAGSNFNDGRTRNAATLDREADALLFLGRHAAAEHLAHKAQSMRQAVTL